jgi:hypothetical protein
MPRRFPNARADGTFKVAVCFTALPSEGLSALQAWLSDWIVANGEWSFFGETRRFFDCFSAAPKALVGSSGDLRIVFLGVSPDARFWKDWYVRLMSEATARFPEIGPPCGVRDEL